MDVETWAEGVVQFPEEEAGGFVDSIFHILDEDTQRGEAVCLRKQSSCTLPESAPYGQFQNVISRL